MATMSVVQSAVGDNGSGATTVSATWGSTTGIANLLLAIVAYNTAGVSTTMSTLPTGWTVFRDFPSLGVNTDVALYGMFPGIVASQSGAQTWTLNASKKAVVVMAEIKGCPLFPFPAHAGGGGNQASGTSTTASVSFPNAIEDIIGFAVNGVCAQNVITFSAPSTSWTLVNQTSSSGGGAGTTKVTGALLFGEVEAIGTLPTSNLTLSASQQWMTNLIDIGRPGPMGCLKGMEY